MTTALLISRTSDGIRHTKDEIAQLTGRIAVVAQMHPRASEWTLRSHVPNIDEVLAVDVRECDGDAGCWAQIQEWLAPGGVDRGGARSRIGSEPFAGLRCQRNILECPGVGLLGGGMVVSVETTFRGEDPIEELSRCELATGQSGYSWPLPCAR